MFLSFICFFFLFFHGYATTTINIHIVLYNTIQKQTQKGHNRCFGWKLEDSTFQTAYDYIYGNAIHIYFIFLASDHLP